MVGWLALPLSTKDTMPRKQQHQVDQKAQVSLSAISNIMSSHVDHYIEYLNLEVTDVSTALERNPGLSENGEHLS